MKLNLEENKECPYCKVGTIYLKQSKYGDFLGCSQYPRCAATQQVKGSLDIGDKYFKDDKGIKIINGKIIL